MTNSMATEENGESYFSLPLWAILPGLIYKFVVDLLTVTGWPGFTQVFLQTWSFVLVVIPWVTLLVVRGSPSMFGYTRDRGLVDYGWGMVADGVWRGSIWASWGAHGFDNTLPEILRFMG